MLPLGAFWFLVFWAPFSLEVVIAVLPHFPHHSEVGVGLEAVSAWVLLGDGGKGRRHLLLDVGEAAARVGRLDDNGGGCGFRR